MADQNTPGAGGQTDANNPAPAPAKTGDDNKGAGAPTIRDEDVVNHPAFKGQYNELKETRARLQKYEADAAEAEKKRLEEQGQFKELATKASAERDEYKGKYEQSLKYNAFVTAAVKAGVTMVEDAWK